MRKETAQWTKMANHLVNMWAETSTQMWKNWFDLMGLVPTRDPITDTMPEFQYIAQRFVDNQDLLLRLLRLSFNAWKEIFPKVEAGENWQHLMSRYTEQMAQQLGDFSVGTLKASKDVTELWQLYIKEMQKFNQLWLSSLGMSIGPMSQTTKGTSEPWLELNNLYWNLLYEQTFGSLMQSPVLGPTREFNGKLLKSFDAWSKLYRASIDYQVVLANIQVRSFEELMQKLVSLAEKGKRVEDWRQFQQIWSEVADGVFEEAFCSEDNLRVRGQFLNALNTYRSYQQELVEVWMKMVNMPLRSEVDEIHKNIYELRKEMKRLKKVSEVDEVYKTVYELREEIRLLRKASETNVGQTIEELRQEVEQLKLALANAVPQNQSPSLPAQEQ